MVPDPPGRWVVAGVVLALALIGGLLVFAGRSRHEDRLVAVESLRATADGHAVEAVVVTNSCGEPRRLIVEETSSRVDVVALVRMDTGGDCEDIGLEHTLTAELSDDIGDRALVAARP